MASVTETSELVPGKPSSTTIDYNRSLAVAPGQRNVVVMGKEGAVIFDGIVKEYPTGPSGFGCYAYQDPRSHQSTPIQLTLDQSMVAMILVDGPYDLSPDYYFPATGNLVFYNGDKAYEIASNVYSFQLTANGEALAYTAKTEQSEMCLFIWYADSEKSEKIQENVNPWYAVSLDGNAVAFSTNENNEETVDTYLFLRSSQSAEKVADQIYPIAVSNDGKYMYGIEPATEGNRLWALCDGQTQKLGENMNKYDEIFINESGSEIVYNTAEGVFLSKEGSSQILLEKNGSLLEQISSALFIQNHDNSEESFPDGANAGLPGVCYVFSEHLAGNLFRIRIGDAASASVWFFSDTNQGVILEGVDTDSIFYAGDSVMFFEKGSKRYVQIDDIYDDALWKDPKAYPYRYIDDISIFEMTSDGTMISLSSDDSICMHRWSGSSIETSCVPAELAKNAWMEEYGCSVFSRENEPDLIYYKVVEPPTSDDRLADYISSYYFTLYVIEDVPDAVPVKVAENVSAVRAGDFGVFYFSLVNVPSETINYYTDPYEYSDKGIFDRNTIFYSSDGINFEYVADTYQRYIFGG